MTNALALRDTLAPSSFSEVSTFAEMISRTPFAPKDYQGKPGNIVAAVIYGADLGFTPMQALQNIAVVNGKPSVYGDGLRALILGRSDCEGIEDDVSGEGEARCATVTIRRRGKTPVNRSFSMADAKRAGLLGKQGPWTQYPDRMLLMRAQGFAIRDAYADVLRGVVTYEEAADYQGPERAKDVTPPSWSHPATTLPSGETVDAETGEVMEPPARDWHAEIAAATSLEALTAIGREMAKAKAGTDELRAAFKARQRALIPAEAEPTPAEPAAPMTADYLATAIEAASDRRAVAALLATDQARAILAALDQRGALDVEKALVTHYGADAADVLAEYCDRARQPETML